MEGIVLLVISGAICAAIASSKGRSVVGWFFIGFFFHFFGVILVLVLSNVKDQDRQREHAKSERRRLKEQLRQERMKNEAFRRHSAGRLDAHDRALGVNTRSSQELAAGARTATGELGAGSAISGPLDVPLRGGAGAPPPRPSSAAWFYLRGDEQKGPVDAGRLTNAFRTGRLPLSTLVWCDGMTDWAAAADVSDFSRGGM